MAELFGGHHLRPAGELFGVSALSCAPVTEENVEADQE
jgi:hypothetical protein